MKSKICFLLMLEFVLTGCEKKPVKEESNIIDKYIDVLTNNVGFDGYCEQYQVDENDNEVLEDKIYLQTFFSSGKFFNQEYFYNADDQIVYNVNPTKYYKDEDTGYVCYDRIGIDNKAKKEFTKDIDDNGNYIINTDQFDDFYQNPFKFYTKKDFITSKKDKSSFFLSSDSKETNRVSMFITRVDEEIDDLIFKEVDNKLKLEIVTIPYTMSDEEDEEEKVTVINKYYFDVRLDIKEAFTTTVNETLKEHEGLKKGLEYLSNLKSYTLIHTETLDDKVIDQHEIKYTEDGYLNLIDTIIDYGDGVKDEYKPNGIAKFSYGKFYKFDYDKETNTVTKGKQVVDYLEKPEAYRSIFSSVAAEMFRPLEDGLFICDDIYVYGQIAERFSEDYQSKMIERYSGCELYIKVKNDRVENFYYDIEHQQTSATGKMETKYRHLVYTFKDLDSTILPIDFSTLS